jgi:hypothetical protein
VPTPRFDDSRWPLYRITLPDGALSDHEFDNFVATLDALYERGQRYAILLDARSAPPLDAKRRQILGERGKAISARRPERLSGFAVLLSSQLQRGIFTAIQWVARMHDRARAFATVGEAETWLLSKLREDADAA